MSDKIVVLNLDSDPDETKRLGLGGDNWVDVWAVETVARRQTYWKNYYGTEKIPVGTTTMQVEPGAATIATAMSRVADWHLTVKGKPVEFKRDAAYLKTVPWPVMEAIHVYCTELDEEARKARGDADPQSGSGPSGTPQGEE